MAQKFEVSQSSYKRWETDTEPRLDVIIELANFFKVPVGDLIAKKMEPKDVPPRWGGRVYPEQPEETAKAFEEPEEEVSIKKLESDMELLRQEVAALKQLIERK